MIYALALGASGVTVHELGRIQLMKKLVMLSVLLLISTSALAVEYTETWDDPLGDWRTRWVALNTNMQNYYVCTGGGDKDQRGNNPCGIWICDGAPDTQSIINFDPTFGASITVFEIGIQAFTDATLNVYDPSNNLIGSDVLVMDFSSPYGCYCTLHTFNTPNGVGRFEIVPNAGGQVEGNMAVDNMRVVAGEPVATTQTTWGVVKALYR